MTKAEEKREEAKAEARTEAREAKAEAKADAKAAAVLNAIAAELDAIAANPTIDPAQVRDAANQLRELAAKD